MCLIGVVVIDFMDVSGGGFFDFFCGVYSDVFFEIVGILEFVNCVLLIVENLGVGGYILCVVFEEIGFFVGMLVVVVMMDVSVCVFGVGVVGLDVLMMIVGIWLINGIEICDVLYKWLFIFNMIYCDCVCWLFVDGSLILVVNLYWYLS